MNASVIDVDFDFTNREKRATALHYLAAGSPRQIALDTDDFLFITPGSMAESSSVGTMTTPAPLSRSRPDVFNAHVNRSRNGEEIPYELFSHLGIVELTGPVMDKVSCAPA